MTESFSAEPSDRPTKLDAEERKEVLAQAVAAQVNQGARVEAQTGFQAVMVSGKPVNHVLHLILTLVTCLLWGLVWAALVIFAGEKRFTLRVDDYGNVLR